MKKIILASASPWRKEILKITGLEFTVCASDYKENLNLSLTPRKLARSLSRKKAETVSRKYKNSIIIAADTFIVFKNTEKMIEMLNGKIHSVITGFTIIDTGRDKVLSRSVETTVYFKRSSKKEITAYVESKEPIGKAGAYAIQGLGAILIEKIDGDFFNVMGLPLSALTESLKKFGVYVLR
ncbi:MAG: Maf family protein [Promethearchaeota archaeon]|jgi:septum formation protein